MSPWLTKDPVVHTHDCKPPTKKAYVYGALWYCPKDGIVWEHTGHVDGIWRMTDRRIDVSTDHRWRGIPVCEGTPEDHCGRCGLCAISTYGDEPKAPPVRINRSMFRIRKTEQ